MVGMRDCLFYVVILLMGTQNIITNYINNHKTNSDVQAVFFFFFVKLHFYGDLTSNDDATIKIPKYKMMIGIVAFRSCECIGGVIIFITGQFRFFGCRFLSIGKPVR